MNYKNYRDSLLSFSRQFEKKALQTSNLSALRRGARPDGIVLVGMGGSGLAGDVLEILKKEIRLPIPLVVWKNYHLPETSFNRPLFIFSSFSGNTEETISGLTDLLSKNGKKKFLLGVVGTGGILKSLAEEYGIPLVLFPAEDLTPREALGYSVNSVITLLKVCFPSLRAAKVFSGNLHPKRFETEGKKLAVVCRNRTVVIYTNSAFAGIGYTWKIFLNETAKHPAFTGVIPENDHNEIGSFEKLSSRFSAIFLFDPKEGIRMRKKMLFTKQALARCGVKTAEVKLYGKTETEKLWNSIVLSEWMSLSLARLKKVEPRRTEFIEHFKKTMKGA